MKLKRLLILIPSALILSAIGIVSQESKTYKADALDIPTTVDLKDNTESEIRNYYSYLNNLPASERRGQNLLKNLKYILVNNPSNPSKPARYFTYAQVRSIYRITDRNWYSSPASGISGYNSSTNKITGFSYSENPYLYYYYRDDNFTNPHRATDTIESKEGSTQTLLNQEHIWSKSHGFSSGNGVPNAGSDLHHLVAADVAVNKWGHSDESYGYVSSENSSWASTKVNWDNGANAILNNKKGTVRNSSSEDETSTVFEPRDEDKGDFARALFFMVARYNYVGDNSTHSIEEPNLELVDHVVSSGMNCSTTSDVAQYGKLSDLLSFHKNDPVITGSTQDFEVHRNNLIYNNYQYTRNPFIDFPEWVDLIWGDQSETGVASPATDTINGYNSGASVTGVSLDRNSATIAVNGTTTLHATITPSNASNKNVTWTSNKTNIATVSGGVVTGKAAGTATITVTTADGGYTASCTVTVSASAPTVTSVTLNKESETIDLANASTVSLTATVNGTNNPSQSVTWSSSNTSVATVNNGTVTCLAKGTAIITATSTIEPSKYGSCTITVTNSQDLQPVPFTIEKGDYTPGYSASGTSGSISKTIVNSNDLTINYAGINTRSSGGSAYSYTMYYGGNGYIYSNNSISGYYPSSVTVNFTSNTGTSGKCGITYSKTATTSQVTTVTGAVSKGGTCTLINSDSTKLFWNFSTITANVQVASISVTYSPIGESGGGGGESSAVDVTGVSLNRSSANLTVNDALQLTATVTPSDADDQTVLWSSDDTSVASVDEDGMVTAHTVGTATITVTTVDGGFTATCDITVASLTPVTGTTATLTITTDDFATHTSFSNDDAWSVDYVNGNGDIGSNTSYIAMNNSTTSRLYNTTELRGYIINITINPNSNMSNSKNLNLYASTSSLEWSSGTPEGGTQYSLSSGSPISATYSKNSHFSYFAIKSLGTATYIDSIVITYDITEYAAYYWATSFNTAMGNVCDATSGNTNLSSLTTAWNTSKTEYQSLDNSVKTLIADSASIYNTTYKNAVNAAISSYTYIAHKYNSLNQFITGISVNANHSITVVSTSKDSSKIVILLVLIGVGASIGIVFTHKKKKIEE